MIDCACGGQIPVTGDVRAAIRRHGDSGRHREYLDALRAGLAEDDGPAPVDQDAELGLRRAIPEALPDRWR